MRGVLLAILLVVGIANNTVSRMRASVAGQTRAPLKFAHAALLPRLMRRTPAANNSTMSGSCGNASRFTIKSTCACGLATASVCLSPGTNKMRQPRADRWNSHLRYPR